jgi:predicted nucleotidyltransferase
LLQPEYRDLAAEYAELVKAHFGDRLVSLCFFGSVVRGEASPESDLDALVIVDGLPRDLGSRIRDTNGIHSSLKKHAAYRRLRSGGRSALISDIYLTRDEARSHPPILLDIADHGVVMYDRADFIADVLGEMREKLKALGARKVRAKKGYYWVLKPDAKPTEVIEV